ncbi:MAG TPA: WXG100 family type VII secretion target [Nocardioides sp.]|nr:WXG100 family type VII secretion target [Nocardioides sp.]
MTIELVHAAFRQAIADVHDAAEELARTRRDVDRKVSGFLGVSWRGDAAESFVPPWGDWVAGAEDAERGLRAMAELLAATQRDFRRNDEASQRSLDAVSARIVERLG